MRNKIYCCNFHKPYIRGGKPVAHIQRLYKIVKQILTTHKNIFIS